MQCCSILQLLMRSIPFDKWIHIIMLQSVYWCLVYRIMILCYGMEEYNASLKSSINATYLIKHSQSLSNCSLQRELQRSIKVSSFEYNVLRSCLSSRISRLLERPFSIYLLIPLRMLYSSRTSSLFLPNCIGYRPNLSLEQAPHSTNLSNECSLQNPELVYHYLSTTTETAPYTIGNHGTISTTPCEKANIPFAFWICTYTFCSWRIVCAFCASTLTISFFPAKKTIT